MWKQILILALFISLSGCRHELVLKELDGEYMLKSLYFRHNIDLKDGRFTESNITHEGDTLYGQGKCYLYNNLLVLDYESNPHKDSSVFRIRARDTAAAKIFIHVHAAGKYSAKPVAGAEIRLKPGEQLQKTDKNGDVLFKTSLDSQSNAITLRSGKWGTSARFSQPGRNLIYVRVLWQNMRSYKERTRDTLFINGTPELGWQLEEISKGRQQIFLSKAAYQHWKRKIKR